MIIDGFLPTTEQLVGIYNNTDYNVLFDDAICTDLKVDDSSVVMSHPLENGSKVSDHQVFNLVKISMTLNLSKKDYNIVFENINAAYRESTLFTVQTKVNIYNNMIIEAKPHVEGAHLGVLMNLSFVEFNVASDVVLYDPRFDEDGDTTKNGLQNGTEVSDAQAGNITQTTAQSIAGFFA